MAEHCGSKPESSTSTSGAVDAFRPPPSMIRLPDSHWRSAAGGGGRTRARRRAGPGSVVLWPPQQSS
eukprot:1492538-Rhodomonas_salina.2